MAIIGCGTPPAEDDPNTDAGAIPTPDAGTSPDRPDAATEPAACATGADGLDCLFALWDRTRTDCDPADVDLLVDAVERRRGTLPAWHDGRALFASFDGAVALAGEFNDWVDDALATTAVCDSRLFAVEAAIASGRHAYKVVDAGAWKLDAENWAFVYDQFEGNADGRNSVLNTYDSGLGHLVQPPQPLCSEQLANCRMLTTYLPPGYGAPGNAQREYTALFMHDGQNIFDDQDCCFGHTGWEINRTLDVEIAAGRVEPIVVVGFDHGGAQRAAEYGYAASVGGLRETFMAFQVTQVQPTAAGYWRLDPDRYFVAGSSLGGFVSFALALTYPDVYRGAASLSGSFWVGEDDDTSVQALVSATGLEAITLYMDHGGSAAEPADNYTSNLALRDLLVGLGWQRSDVPSCVPGDVALCYFHDVGATHDELAWRDRAHHFVRFLFPAE